MLNMGSVNINGTSKIDGKETVYFNASLSGGNNGNYSITKSIADKPLYMENQEECEADYAEFDSAALDIMNQIDNEH